MLLETSVGCLTAKRQLREFGVLHGRKECQFKREREVCAQSIGEKREASFAPATDACLSVQASISGAEQTGLGLLRQAQDALGDNVGLNFVAAAVNRSRLGVQPFFNRGQFKVAETITMSPKSLGSPSTLALARHRPVVVPRRRV